MAPCFPPCTATAAGPATGCYGNISSPLGIKILPCATGFLWSLIPYRLCDMLGVCAVVNLQHLCFGILHLETYENISSSTKDLFSKGYCSCTHTCTLYDYVLLFSKHERRKPKLYHVWKRREKLLYSLEWTGKCFFSVLLRQCRI